MKNILIGAGLLVSLGEGLAVEHDKQFIVRSNLEA